MPARTHHQQNNNRHRRTHIALIVITVLLIIGGVIIFTLNTEKVITGPWSDILGPSSTALGLILSLFQILPSDLLLQIPALNYIVSRSHMTGSIRKQAVPAEPEDPHPPIMITPPKTRRGKGRLIVYTRKNLRGETIDLSKGFDIGQLNTHKATNIVERLTREGHKTYIGTFEDVDPDNYTVSIDSRQRTARVTILPGKTAEIDWR